MTPHGPGSFSGDIDLPKSNNPRYGVILEDDFLKDQDMPYYFPKDLQKIFILKVQQSLSTTEEYPQMLAYDEKRKYTFQHDLTDAMGALLGDRPKAYFNAIINHKNALEVFEEVEEQDW